MVLGHKGRVQREGSKGVPEAQIVANRVPDIVSIFFHPNPSELGQLKIDAAPSK